MAGGASFEQIIQHMLSANNESRQAAEAAFEEAKQQPDVLVGNLVQSLRGCQETEIRALCAVMLRRVSLHCLVGRPRPLDDLCGYGNYSHGLTFVLDRCLNSTVNFMERFCISECLDRYSWRYMGRDYVRPYSLVFVGADKRGAWHLAKALTQHAEHC